MHNLLTSLETRIPPPIVMALCATGLWLTHTSVPIALFDFADTATRWTTVLAVIVFLLGVSIDLVSLKRFFSAKTTINPLKPEQASSLVTSGIYAITRNPMYVGLMLWLLAGAIYSNNPICLIWPAFFILYINRFQIQPEERFLSQLFADDYQQYLQQTPRWLFFK